MKNQYLKKAKEFFELGKKEYEERSQKLDTLGLGTTYDSVKERLHDTCYYGDIIKPDWLKHAIDSIREEIERWSIRL